MRSSLEPEIIPPQRKNSIHRTLTDENLDQLASVLDDFIVIPGTGIRVGLDAIVGLIPGIGDLLTGIASFLFIYAGWQRGLPRVTLARMVANVAIDTLVGSMPIFGDIFDAAWKSNRKNYLLLTRAERLPTRKQTLQDWLFLGLMALMIAALIAVPVLVLIWVIQHLRG